MQRLLHLSIVMSADCLPLYNYNSLITTVFLFANLKEESMH